MWELTQNWFDFVRWLVDNAEHNSFRVTVSPGNVGNLDVQFFLLEKTFRFLPAERMFPKSFFFLIKIQVWRCWLSVCRLQLWHIFRHFLRLALQICRRCSVFSRAHGSIIIGVTCVKYQNDSITEQSKRDSAVFDFKMTFDEPYNSYNATTPDPHGLLFVLRK